MQLFQILTPFAPCFALARSSWSRADEPIIIGDFTEAEALEYLHDKLDIEKEKAQQLYGLVGGHIHYIYDVRKSALLSIKERLKEANMLEGLPNYTIGKRIIQEVLTKKQIDLKDYYKIINDKKVADQILQASVSWLKKLSPSSLA
ncbi:hypothetical protein BC936DRAFT_146752 [Jimgerdemannia flammicorona]|uniref:Uncharacterized protein n=1 Tax=Jimgerdemannia flammicorona TaxID=994334 RepID=A0A433D6Y6_9FUNG|nr:hypothetical protein BC936DRAFT_146752 [Jimgerdemannia flammicorona]